MLSFIIKNDTSGNNVFKLNFGYASFTLNTRHVRWYSKKLVIGGNWLVSDQNQNPDQVFEVVLRQITFPG